MKILLVNKYFNMHGGSETYFFGLADLLRQAGHEVIYFAMQDEKNLPCEQSAYFVSNVEFNGKLTAAQKLKAAFRMVYSFEAKKKISALIEKEKPDIIHINLFHRVLTASIVDAAKKHGIPVVFTMHDLNCVCPNHVMLDHGKICEACLHGNYWNCVKRVCFKDSRAKCLMAAIESDFNKRSGLYRKIDLFITPSEVLQKQAGSVWTDKIAHCAHEKLPSGGYKVCRAGQTRRLCAVLRAAFGGKGYPDAGSGNGEAGKCSAYHCRHWPGGRCHRAEIEAHHLNQRVTMVGFQSGENLWQYVRNCACVVVPSEWYEASGYTACEAQAMGKPVVATNAGGLPENIVDGETGFISPMKDEAALADAIGRVMRLSDEEYQRMAEKSVANAKKLFDASGYVAKLLVLYANLKRRGN